MSQRTERKRLDSLCTNVLVSGSRVWNLVFPPPSMQAQSVELCLHPWKYFPIFTASGAHYGAVPVTLTFCRKQSSCVLWAHYWASTWNPRINTDTHALSWCHTKMWQRKICTHQYAGESHNLPGFTGTVCVFSTQSDVCRDVASSLPVLTSLIKVTLIIPQIKLLHQDWVKQ